MKFKVLPITIAACFLLIAVKTAEVAGAFKDSLVLQETSEAKVLAKIQTAAGDEKAVKTEEKVDEKKAEAEAKHGEASAEKPKQEAPTNVHATAPAENLPKYNDSEKLIIEKLAARRAELDEWSKNLDMKEELIDASSKKLDKKLEDLKTLKEQTEKLLAEYKEQDDAKIRSLVKMYEAMKPASAAAILEDMNMGILLEIVDKMTEKKASLVLAKMSPKKAKQITEDLARQRSLAVASGVDSKSAN